MPKLPYLTQEAALFVLFFLKNKKKRERRLKMRSALCFEKMHHWVDDLAHPWPNALLYGFLLLSLIGPTLQSVPEFRHSLILIAPYWAREIVDSGDNSTSLRPTLASPVAQRPSISGEIGDFYYTTRHKTALCVCLAHERMNLNAIGLPSTVIDTHTLCMVKWRVFERWCAERPIISFLCYAFLLFK